MSGTSGKRKVTFAIEASVNSEVSVSGTFNDWELMTLDRQSGSQDETGKFHKAIYLPAGRYEYKFLIDGSWSIDPNCPSWSPNEHGSLNSVVDVM